MLAARLHGPRDLRVERVPHPGAPGPGEALIRVTAVGICGSDLHTYTDGRIGDTVVKGPLILGHEFAGVIEALVFPEAFQKLEPILKAATPLLIKGRVAVEDVGTRVIVGDARPLDRMIDQIAAKSSNGAPSLLRVRMNRSSLDTGIIDRLHELFQSHPGRCRIAFELVQDDGSEATIDAGSAVQADRELVERVREICGNDSVAVLQ